MIPLYALLIAYLVFLLVFIIFFLINVHHIVVSAAMTLSSFIVTFFVIAIAVITIFWTWRLLGSVDWQQPLIKISASVFEPRSF